MSASTYGLTTDVRTQASGGETLLGLGSAQKRQGMALLGHAAEEDTRRQIQNRQIEQDRKAGNAQLGSSVGSAAGLAIGTSIGASSAAAGGATTGSVAGPWGALIGGALGYIAGQYF